jgi:hypothetical protein
VTHHRVEICRLADEAAAADGPESALRTLRELRAELVAFERSRAADALRSGSSFGDIAKALGISRQAAHRRYRDLAPKAGDPLPLSSHARQAVNLAREEARASGTPELGSEHLLLGVLRSGGGASSALEAEGVTADAARGCLAGSGRRTATRDAGSRGGTVLAQAAEIAGARNARYVEADHIVLAALTDPDGGALRALTSLGVTAAAVRDRLGC